jgi:hypothetical protein
MSVKACLPGLVADGKISQDDADRAGKLYDELHQDFRRQFGDQAASKMASDETLRAMQNELTRKRFLAARKIQSQQTIAMDLGFGGALGPEGIAAGEGAGGTGGAVERGRGVGLFAFRQDVPYRNVDGIRRAVERRAFSTIAELLQKFHSDVLGRVRGVALQRDIVRELFGKDTGNADAKAMADAWRSAAESLRQQFNALGGNIGKIDDWGLPQGHDTDKVRNAGFAAWFAFIKDRLDLTRMTDLRTGLKFTPETLEDALREVYETIRTGGWYGRDPGSMGLSSLANSRADARFLIFKDADAWLEYHEQFGQGEIFHAMIGHVKGMARDIGAMDRFGPNPQAGVQLAKDMVDKAAAMVDDQGQANRAAQSEISKMDSLWAEYTGANKRPSEEWIANIGSAIRTFETAKNLGSAVFSAVPGDLATQLIAAKFNGLPFTKTLLNITRQMNPLDPEWRLIANRMGMIYEGWTHHAAVNMRGFGDEVAAGMMGRVAESTLRVTGLGAWTDVGHAGFGMSVLGHMADMAGRSFDQLDRGFRQMLARNGMGPAEWDAIRVTPLQRVRGNDWLFPQDIADHTLGDRVLSMIGTEQDIAVPINDFATRAAQNESLKRGTVLGETVKSAMLFKSFGIAMLTNQAKRIMMISSWRGRAGYLAGLITATTIAGAATLQMREIAQGRDPRPMDPRTPQGRDFWTNAVFQGGGFGIAGDILGLVAEPRIGNWGEFLTGPVVGTAQNIGMLAGKGLQHLAFEAGLREKDANVAGQLVTTARQEMPGGNIWYSRLAFQRLVSDTLSAAIDPNYLQARARTLARAREAGSGYWWAPGETQPGRAPNLANVTAQQPEQGQ